MRALGCPPPPGGRPRGCPPPGGRTLGEAEGEGSEVVGEDGDSIGSIGPASACEVDDQHHVGNHHHDDHHRVVKIKMITMIMMMMLPDACSPPLGAFCSTRFATVKDCN